MPRPPKRPNLLADWFRTHPDYSQALLADQCGVSASLMSMKVNGSRGLTGEAAIKCAEITGVPLPDILRKHPTRRKPKHDGRRRHPAEPEKTWPELRAEIAHDPADDEATDDPDDSS